MKNKQNLLAGVDVRRAHHDAEYRASLSAAQQSALDSPSDSDTVSELDETELDEVTGGTLIIYNPNAVFNPKDKQTS